MCVSVKSFTISNPYSALSNTLITLRDYAVRDYAVTSVGYRGRRKCMVLQAYSPRRDCGQIMWSIHMEVLFITLAILGLVAVMCGAFQA